MSAGRIEHDSSIDPLVGSLLFTQTVAALLTLLTLPYTKLSNSTKA